MPSERKFQCKERRLASRAAHAPACVQDENQSMRARVGCERKNFDRFSVDLRLEVSNRNIFDRKILLIAQGNWQAPSQTGDFLRPSRWCTECQSQKADDTSPDITKAVHKQVNSIARLWDIMQRPVALGNLSRGAHRFKLY